jgi:hypothetical protein
MHVTFPASAQACSTHQFHVVDIDRIATAIA